MLATHLPSNRLYVVTGKGGVGKSSLALGLVRALIDENKSPLYVTLDNDHGIEFCQKERIPCWKLDPLKSGEEYIARKLGSTLIAHWVMKTPFFNALFNMVPAISQMILMGHLIDRLEKETHLTIVLDAPATGHAISMFEATSNFGEIFQIGHIFDDIMRMKSFMSEEGNLMTLIALLPQSLAKEEAIELHEYLITIGMNRNQFIINQTLADLLKEERSLPAFLQERVSVEKDFLKSYPNSIVMPYTPLPEESEIIDFISEKIRASLNE